MNATTDDPTAERPSRTRFRHAWMAAGVMLTMIALIAGSLGVVTVWAVVRGADTKHDITSQSYPRAPARVEVENGARGTVSIAGRDTDRLDVERDLTWSRAEPSVDETWVGDTFRVDTECPNPRLMWVSHRCSVDYEAAVPRDAAADVHSPTGSIDVRDVGGGVALTSTTGDIIVDDVAGPLSAQVTTGEITGANLDSTRAAAETTTGDITLGFTASPERVEAVATTGDVIIEVPNSDDPYRVDVQSKTGEQHVEVSQDPEAERVIDVTISTGDVHIRYASETGPASDAEPTSTRAEPGSTRNRLRQDVHAINDLGVTGVLAEAQTADGRIVERAGVSDRRTGRPISDHAVFRNGSNTKTFLATVVLQLVGEGRLHLDDTVEEWLPGLIRGNGNDGSRITVGQLLQHTSGLYDYVADVLPGSAEEYRERRFDRYTPRELVAIAMEHRPEFPPGTSHPDGTPRWSYTNTGYVLLGMIVGEATGKTWRQQIGDRIIEPLNLRNTTLPEHETTLPRPRLHGYKQFAPDGPLKDVTALNPSIADASGSMITTTTDVNRFFRALLSGELLPPPQQSQLQRTVPTGWGGEYEGTRYGLGIFWYPLPCTDAGYWAHGGGILGYMTRNAVSDDGDEGVTIAMSSELGGGRSARQSGAATAAIRNVLC